MHDIYKNGMNKKAGPIIFILDLGHSFTSSTLDR